MTVRTIEALEPRCLFTDTLNAGITLSKTYQTIDAIGAAMNSGYQLPEYRQASYFNKVVGDLGISAVRSALDPGWELTNDNNDPNTINWAGFNDGAIANTMEFFKQAKARGVKTFLLSFWSPSAWMKTNKASRHGGQLRPDLRDEYGEYITAALLRAHDKWGVDITQISIGNEPWFTAPYPNTVWTPDEMALTIKVVAKHLKAAGLTNVQITGPEDVSSLARTKSYVNAIAADPEANADYPIVGIHYLNDQDAQTLAQSVASLHKKLWYTEVGDGAADINGAMGVARGIDSAFTRAGATAWFNWQISGSTPLEDLMSGQTPNPKYYALKQFAHFIKPGYQRVDVNYTGDLIRVSAYKDPATGNLTIVMSNDRTTDATVNLSLAGGTIAKTFEQFRTSASENCVQLANIAGAASMSVNMPAGSIVTLYSGPDAAPLTNITAAPLVPVPQYADAWSTNPLRQAAMLGEYDTAKQLVDGGADVNAAFGNGWTPLFTAAASPYNKADQILSYLIQHGADVQHKDVEGFTALHVAAMSEIPAYGTVDTIAAQRVKMLLAAGINVNAKDGYGRTPLMYAAMLPKMYGDLATVNTSVIQALLDAGADKSIKDNAGKTALDWATAEHATEAIKLLGQPAPPPPTGTAVLSGYVVNDKNKDGAWTSGEAGIAGRTVFIDANNNGTLDANEQSQVTSSAGKYIFANMPAGTYTLRQILPDGWTQTRPAAGNALVATVKDGVTRGGLDFCTVASSVTPPPPPPPPPGTASIHAYVINDTNKDGKWSSGETGISGRTVWIDADKDGLLDAGEKSTTTGTNGAFDFTGLAAGTYSIRQILPSGWKQTYPAAALVITLTEGQAKSGSSLGTATI